MILLYEIVEEGTIFYLLSDQKDLDKRLNMVYTVDCTDVIVSILDEEPIEEVIGSHYDLRVVDAANFVAHYPCDSQENAILTAKGIHRSLSMLEERGVL